MCFAINPMIASSLVTCVCETNKMTKRTIAIPIRIRRKGKCWRINAKNCDLKRVRRKNIAGDQGLGVEVDFSTMIERSEERRVGQECRARWSREEEKKKNKDCSEHNTSVQKDVEMQQ